jgi:hypothetical protein
MWVLLGSGIVYLVGISIVLVLRPELMFDEDGVWKEFRIGGDRRRYTWMPFWLFAILWAVISFILVHLISRSMSGPAANVNAYNVAPPSFTEAAVAAPPATVKVPKRRGASLPLPPGYYMLDKEAFNGTGTPHYVYIGPTPEAGNLEAPASTFTETGAEL